MKLRILCLKLPRLKLSLLNVINDETCEKVLEVEQKYNEIRKPVYDKRSEITNSIPDFWLTAFLSHPSLGELLSEEDQKIKYVKELSWQTCQICGDDVEITVDGELFVVCNECAFPICRPCYEYEKRENSKISFDRHALITPPSAGHGNRIHPMPSNPSTYFQVFEVPKSGRF